MAAGKRSGQLGLDPADVRRARTLDRQVGKPIVIAYLTAPGQTLGNDRFTYLREVIDGDTAVLEFQTEMDGIQINGIDMITFDQVGMIKDFKVMVRPLKAVNKVWEMMAAQLERMKG